MTRRKRRRKNPELTSNQEATLQALLYFFRFSNLSPQDILYLQTLVENAPEHVGLGQLSAVASTYFRVSQLRAESPRARKYFAEIVDYLNKIPYIGSGMDITSPLSLMRALDSYATREWKQFPIVLLLAEDWNPDRIQYMFEDPLVYTIIMRFLNSVNYLLTKVTLSPFIEPSDTEVGEPVEATDLVVSKLWSLADQLRSEWYDYPTSKNLLTTPIFKLFDTIGSHTRLSLERFNQLIYDFERVGMAENKARDRLAQAKPRWAISQYLGEFEIGKRLAPLYRKIIDELDRARRAKQRHRKTADVKFVIHGRDCEMLYLVARKVAPELYKQMVYVLTPRALTSDRSSYRFTTTEKDYDAYLSRMIASSVPQVHVDTGFQGSIPRWFKDQGWDVRNILLISTGRKEFGLLPESHGDSNEARDLREAVQYQIEHSPQRLVTLSGSDTEKLSKTAKWGAWPYSKDAPGFWARYYGVLDGMGIPEEKWRPNVK